MLMKEGKQDKPRCERQQRAMVPQDASSALDFCAGRYARLGNRGKATAGGDGGKGLDARPVPPKFSVACRDNSYTDLVRQALTFSDHHYTGQLLH